MEPLVVKRILNASIEDVFKAWTELDQMKQWYCPEGMTVGAAEADVKAGGAYKIEMKSPDGKTHTVVGKYTEVSAPNKLVFSWKWEGGMDGDNSDSEVTIELKDMDGKTELTLTHDGLGSEESKGQHEHGWGLQLNNLEKHLA